jgi:hypothetical protein
MTDTDLPHEPFMDIAPRKGFLHAYLQYTNWSEAPAAFHFFTGAAVLGATLSRRAWFQKGYYKVFPNHQVILVAPTGKCRKTSALNLGLGLLRELDECNVLADKITPEALASELSSLTVGDKQLLAAKPAEGVIYAPELAVFLGKQKYNEGLITLLTALFDNPDKWEISTKGAGKTELHNVCPDWLITAIPQDAFGGGFMSRLLFVVQEDTPRCFPIPDVRDKPQNLTDWLRALRKQEIGEMHFKTPQDKLWYQMWYTASKKNVPEDEKMAGYHERKPDHLLRLAMVIAVSEERIRITTEDMVTANKLLGFLEESMLKNFKWLGSRPIGVDQSRILQILRAHGGQMRSGDLLRRLVFYMNGMQYRQAIETLLHARLIGERPDLKDGQHTYYLTEPPQEERGRGALRP